LTFAEALTHTIKNVLKKKKVMRLIILPSE
jgi:hypothetical protein